MSKYVRRIIPFGSGDIPAVQHWLEDMAEKGLFFKECGLLFAKFTRGEPKKMRYRLDFCDVVACDIPDEKKELYEQSGWHVVGDYNSDLVVVCTDEPDAPEIYTDPELLVKPLKKLAGKQLACWIVFWLLSGWVDFGTLASSVILGDSSFVRYLLDFNTLYYIGLCLLSLLLLFEAIYHFIGWLRVRKLVKKLKNGEELPQGERRGFRAAVGKVLCPLAVPAVILWGVHLFFIGYPIGLNMGEPIKDIGSMPFPTPAELGIECGGSCNNYGKEHRDVLASEVAEYTHSNDYYGKDAFRYEVRYYDMRTQSMAKTLYADFVASASSFDPEQYALFADEIHKSNNAGCWDGEYMPQITARRFELDGAELTLVRDRFADSDYCIEQILCIRFENQVEYVLYQGGGSIEDFAQDFVDCLKKEA